ncbi:MAG: glycosyltransferase family 4 protein [Myxococcota bacterium]
MKRFALDARKLADFGIGSYVAGLAGALPAVLDDEELVLLGDRQSAAQSVPELARQRWIHDASPRYSLRELWSLSRSAGSGCVDLLHVPHYTLPFSPPCPVVVTIHDLVHLRFPEDRTSLHHLYARWMIRRAVRDSAAVVTVSEATRHELQERYGALAKRAVAIPNGVDERFFLPVSPESVAALAERLALPAGYLLFVGNPMPHKNLHRLLDAYAGLRRELPSAPTLALAGDRGGPGSRLSGLVRRTGIEEAVRIVGHLPAADLPALYAGASLLVVPSLWEGFGLPAAEAMACGTPVLVSNRGGLPEVVGDAGELVDPLSADAIATAIWRLLHDPGRRAQLARAGRERARRFRWSESARRTLEVYRGALKRPRSAA